MKNIFFIFLSISLFILSACSTTNSDTDSSSAANGDNEMNQAEKTAEDNSESSQENNDPKTFDINSMIDNTNIETEGSWIQEDGSLAPHSDFVITEPIEYNSKNTYKIHLSGYIAYYEGEDFIKTVRYSNEIPTDIESVPNANYIKVNYRSADFN